MSLLRRFSGGPISTNNFRVTSGYTTLIFFVGFPPEEAEAQYYGYSDTNVAGGIFENLGLLRPKTPPNRWLAKNTFIGSLFNTDAASGGSSWTLNFYAAGIHTNSGFTSLTATSPTNASKVFDRTSAIFNTYSGINGDYSGWQWSGATLSGSPIFTPAESVWRVVIQ